VNRCGHCEIEHKPEGWAPLRCKKCGCQWCLKLGFLASITALWRACPQCGSFLIEDCRQLSLS